MVRGRRGAARLETDHEPGATKGPGKPMCDDLSFRRNDYGRRRSEGDLFDGRGLEDPKPEDDVAQFCSESLLSHRKASRCQTCLAGPR